MQSTFKKTLLASLVLFGLTACGSGGGGGSSAPTTSSNTDSSITVPNVSNQNTDTAGTALTNGQTNKPQTPIVTPSTFKITNDGYATGKATYAAAGSSVVLNADFDKREISGHAVHKIKNQTINITLEKTTLYKGTAKYINGNYPRYREVYDFDGKASGISSNQEKFSGEYAGFIYGINSSLSQAGVHYALVSEGDNRRKISSFRGYTGTGYDVTDWYKKGINSYLEGGHNLTRQ